MLTVGFDFDALDSEEHRRDLETIRLAKEETIARLFAILLDGNADAMEVGFRVNFIAYGMGIHPAKSQRELAARLNISQATVSRKTSKKRKHSNAFDGLLKSLMNHSAH